MFDCVLKQYSVKRNVEIKSFCECLVDSVPLGPTREADPEKQNKAKIDFLEKKVARLEKEKKDLITRNSRLTSMLGKTLEFMETVRKSPFGKIFFGKTLKKYEDDTKKLPEGREDK